MFFKLREAAGWLLVVAGLALIWMAIGYVQSRQVIEAGVLVFAAGIIFRGGTALIRTSTAARICLTAERQSAGSTAPSNLS